MNMSTSVYVFFSRRIMAGAFVLPELLLLSKLPWFGLGCLCLCVSVCLILSLLVLILK
jgi:hypothetical protein